MFLRISREKKLGKRSCSTIYFCLCDSCKKEEIQFNKSVFLKRKIHICKSCLVFSRKKGGKIYEQISKTCFDKYGVENVFQSEVIKEKIVKTWQNNYGVDNPSKSAVIKQQLSEILTKASSSNEVREKTKKTCLERYGADSFLKTQNCKDALHQYALAHNVAHHTQLDSVKNKMKETCLKRFGVENASQADIIKIQKKETCQKNFNVDWPGQSEIVKEKIEKTCLKRYGVKNPSQLPEIRSKANKKRRISCVINHWKTQEELVCVGSYEQAFVEWCNKNEIDFDWQISHKMPDGRVYIIDAFIKTGEFANTWVEIKGWLNGIGLEKWKWFHSEHPNDSQLWNLKRLKNNGVWSL